MRRRLMKGCSIGTAMTLLLTTGAELRAQVTEELDAYWAEVSRTVAAGDFEGYSSTYHPDAVVIFGMASQPISSALAGWEQGFTDTRAGRTRLRSNFGSPSAGTMVRPRTKRGSFASRRGLPQVRARRSISALRLCW